MNLFQDRIQEVIAHFNADDVFLAFRRLLDCVMDTEDMGLYQDAILLTSWKEENPLELQSLKERSLALLDKVSKVSVTPYDTAVPIVLASELTKSYGVGRFSLGPISLSIKKGQVYGLVGENGNGKTTLLRMLAHELHLSSGSIKYNFTKQTDGDYALRTKLIYIPQRTEKWYGSLKDNLRFVLSNYNAKPEEIEPRMMMMICRLGLWKYQYLNWDQLSSGYKMRFELARTLLRRPEILLLDEPLANLDVLAQQVILEDLKYICNAISKPIALILSSQQLYEVEKVSDKVIFLKDGQYNESMQSVAKEDLKHLIVEIDANIDKETLQTALSALDLQHLTYNGGVFIAQFDISISFPKVLELLGNTGMPITYVRDISTSTRRFFVA